MDFLASPTRRRFLFGSLYLSEGAPIGFIWLGLPTRLRGMDVPLDRISWLMALLILPWTLKFLWAPLVDLLQGSRWGLKQWIVSSQSLMTLTLVPMLWLDLKTEFAIVSAWLLAHAFCAATQDVAIDALCIGQSSPAERGSLNGWMQCGVLVGRALMGGGGLILERYIGFRGVVVVLMGLIAFSAVLLMMSTERRSTEPSDGGMTLGKKFARTGRELLASLRRRMIWIGFLFALFAPAAFKSLEAIMGPFLIDRGYDEFQVGQFASTAVIIAMIAGSLFAGRFSHRFTDRRLLMMAVLMNLLAITTLAISDHLSGHVGGAHLLIALTVIAATIGCFTVSMYNWLMNQTEKSLAATQFTAFMAASNVCEAWSTALIGKLQITQGYPVAILTLVALSATAATILLAVAGRAKATNH